MTANNLEVEDGLESGTLPGVIEGLGPTSLITLDGLAGMLKRSPCSIRRAIARGELPESTRLCGTQVWTAECIWQHITGRLEMESKLTNLRP